MVPLVLQAVAAAPWLDALVVALLVVVVIGMKSLWVIGPTQVGLVRKRVSRKRVDSGSPVALDGAAGYQADLLAAGLRFKLWPWYTVTRHPFVQIPAGQIGVVIAQVGKPLPIGAKSAIYKPEFGNFQDIRAFMTNGGEKGVQRPVLPPGTVAAIHPVGFLVVAATPSMACRWPTNMCGWRGPLGRAEAATFGLSDEQLEVVRIQPHATLGRQDGRHGRHRHDAGRLAAAQGRHRQPAGRLRGHRGARGKPGRPRQRPGRGAAVGQERQSTTTTRTSRPSSTTAAASACSTTRCSTAPTTSTRSWWRWKWCRCWWCSRARSR